MLLVAPLQSCSAGLVQRQRPIISGWWKERKAGALFFYLGMTSAPVVFFMSNYSHVKGLFKEGEGLTERQLLS